MTELTSYQKSLIDEIVIPEIRRDRNYVDFQGVLHDRLDSDCFKNNNSIDRHKCQQQINAQIESITEYLCENGFVKLRLGTNNHDKTDESDKLKKAGSLDKYFEEKEREKEENKAKMTFTGNLNLGTIYGNQEFSSGDLFSKQYNKNNIEGTNTEKGKSFIAKHKEWVIAIIILILSIIAHKFNLL